MRRLTIIGCGWFGLPFARTMVERGWEVLGSVRDPDRSAALSGDGIQGFTFDLGQDDYPAAPFAEAVVVIAVPAGRRAGNSESFIQGVSRLLDHALRHGSRAVVVISSTGIYEGLDGEVDEDTQPVDEGNVLVQLERKLERAEIRTCAVRFGGLIGPDRHPGRFLAGRKDLKGGARLVNLVQGSDCVRALKLLLETPLEDWPARMNVVSPEHPSRSEYYPRAARELGLTPPTFQAEACPAAGREVRARWLERQGFEFSPLEAP